MNLLGRGVLVAATIAAVMGALSGSRPVQAAEPQFCIGMLDEDGNTVWMCAGGLGACKSASDCPY